MSAISQHPPRDPAEGPLPRPQATRMTLEVRPAEPGDASALQALNHAFNGERMPVEWIKASLAAPHSAERVLVAVEAGEIIGFCCLSITRSFATWAATAEITELFVLPRHRRRQAARRLVSEALHLAELAQAKEMRVLTGEGNLTAHACYEATGFAVEDDRVYTQTIVRGTNPEDRIQPP